MRKCFKNTKGAVTVFVTLLLIPAILISGSAVDLARIHTARSVMQDANQLASNSVLTQYDALLQDLYGLFGVAEDDPILGNLLDDYIKVAVFGESLQDKRLGTLQVLYGSDLSLDDLTFYSDRNLENTDILRRQIEEYMKFRAPVIIVEEILKALKDSSLKADKEVIEAKTEIDSDIEGLYNKYKELYEAITAADKLMIPVGGIAGAQFGTVSSHLQLIRTEFVELKSCYAAWESLVYVEPEPGDDDDEDSVDNSYEDFLRAKNDCAAQYYAIMGNIRSFVLGGFHGTNWSDGRWGKNSTVVSLNSLIEIAKQNGDKFKSKFDTVVSIARELDAMHDELKKKLDDLEQKLNAEGVSDELKKGFTEKNGNPPKSLIDQYREILKWDNITAMAEVYKKGGYSYIDNEFKPMLDGVKYRNANNPSAASLTREELASLQSNSAFNISESTPAASSRAAYFANFPESSVTYGMPPGFLKFYEHPGENREFFDALSAMAKQPSTSPVKLYDGQEEEEGKDAEDKQRGMIKALLRFIETAYAGLANEPLGAKRIYDDATPEVEKPGILDILKLIPKALTDPITDAFEDPAEKLARAGDYALLLTYSMSMFSNYTTVRPESVGKNKDDLSEITFPKSVTGVKISPEVNYFFQSEWEYLYNGSKNAGANLSSVTRLIFLVRLICNYIVVFNVKEVTAIVTSIQASFAWCPPLGILLGELARAAFAAAEAVLDVALLRSGYKVPLIKNVSENQWICSPSGVISALDKIMSEEADGIGALKYEKGLTYSNFMLFFFISKASSPYFGKYGTAATELALFTGNLIEWNVINYKNGVNADEGKMTEALAEPDRFKLSNMATDFSITTSAKLRMLFLSLPFAQKGIDGVVPPATMRLTVSDHRGY